MKLGLKLFAGLLATGAIAAIVPTVLTSCTKDESKSVLQDDFNHDNESGSELQDESNPEESGSELQDESNPEDVGTSTILSLYFDAQHDDTEKMNAFFANPEFIFDPVIDGLTVDEGDNSDFIKGSFMNERMISNSDKAWKVLFNEKLPKAYIKFNLLDAVLPICGQDNFSNTQENGKFESLEIDAEFSQNAATMNLKFVYWIDDQKITDESISFARMTDSTFEFASRVRTDLPIEDKIERIDTSMNWFMYKDAANEYCFGIQISNEITISLYVCNEDYTSIKSLYDTHFLSPLQGNKVTFKFNTQQDDTEKMNAFFSNSGYIFNPIVEGLSVGKGDDNDFVRSDSGIMHNALISNSDSAKELLFNENFPIFFAKSKLFGTMSHYKDPELFSNMPITFGVKSIIFNMEISENVATLHFTEKLWILDEEKVVDLIEQITWSDDKITIVSSNISNDPGILKSGESIIEINTSNGWWIDMSGHKQTEFYFYFKIGDTMRDIGIPISDNDCALLKMLYDVQSSEPDIDPPLQGGLTN